MKLISPVSYQGGKQRIAGKIIDIINPNEKHFYDLCCGSGAVSIELLNRGFDKNNIHMVDVGPWGMFWGEVGSGSFDLDRFKSYCDLIPVDPIKIKDFLSELAKTPANIDPSYIFLLLQAGSFGSKAIWINDGKWVVHGFRNYWQPTATSNRRSHVNPMMPMPKTLFDRTVNVCENMFGVKAEHIGVKNYFIEPDSIVYIDPPYNNMTVYGETFDVVEFALASNRRCYVSEAYPLNDKAIQITTGNKKGGISGERANSNEEWLSEF